MSQIVPDIEIQAAKNQTITHEEIIVYLESIVGKNNVVVDEATREENSIDLYRKWQKAKKSYTRPIPEAIVMVHSAGEVAEILKYADHHGINVIPRTGNSGIEQGLESARKLFIILDASEMNEILNIDIENMQVTAQAGVSLELMENLLREKGYTTGHSPQSKPAAQMGGLVATRSIGQFSTLYGGIEDMIVGLEAVLPSGEIVRIKNVPRRAAGPDIRHVFVGNEGAIAYITEVTVKLFKYMPDNTEYMIWNFENLEKGWKMLREVMVSGYRPAVARVYDAGDAGIHSFSKGVEGKHILMFSTEGNKLIADATARGIREIVAQDPEFKEMPSEVLAHWLANLNWDHKRIQDEITTFGKEGNVGYTTEISAGWSEIHNIFEAVVARVMAEVPDMQGIGGHSSHSYINGTNIYFVYGYYVKSDDPEDEVTKYHHLVNKIIVEETLKRGGSMCHHHGIGKARAPYVKDEYESSYIVMKKLMKAFDPNNTMNAGTIIPIPFFEEADE
ncbi:hypothetical protein RU97_GL002225 [Enterococcus canis]|uniref:FAD-binding PCMH-type domain-containing protein n=1 Tax=Enterococcus canis TaxID=214095 RepID=A0A1L8REP2_9ENTE|nr:FAD-binding oxidoreductase [Enterococcus canis]OJG18152.1 hypothetical protein RU97_GL002225 [Enterococcus canis]